MTSRTLQTILTLILGLIIISCRKNDDADIVAYKIVNQESLVKINNTTHSIDITFPETFDGTTPLVAEFLLSEGATATINSVFQVSGITSNSYIRPFGYEVRSENRKNIIRWQVTAGNSAVLQTWGLGNYKGEEESNERNYEWYLDQANTGLYSSINCGPTSTTMAAKWAVPSFSKVPADARAAYRPEDGWWRTTDIDSYLNDNNIQHYFDALNTTETGTQQVLRSKIDAANIVILCLDMFYIRSEFNVLYRTDKFYTTSGTGWGHFIVVKGYKIVDGQFWFEVYDPYSLGMCYADNVLKGRNRYYRSADIFTATSKWWNYTIVITPTGTKKAISAGLDPATIPVQIGR
jgi:hypothetical protein